MTHTEKTGGAAFPVGMTYEDGSSVVNLGMTLRDYFAGQALASIAGIYNGQAFDPDGTARAAYELADAMIKARARQ